MADLNTGESEELGSTLAVQEADDEAEPQPVAARPDRRLWLLAVFPALLAAAAFAAVVQNPFVDWDDSFNFINNPDYRGLGWAQIRWDWSTLHMGVYQPLSWMLFSAEYVASGLNPRGYHITSLLLYVASTVVLYWLTVVLLTRSRPGGEPVTPVWVIHAASALAVALFVVHPLRTEVVAWVSCQPYVPCGLFCMLAVLAYLHAHPEGQRTRVGWVVVAFLLFAMALLFKAAAIGLPLVLLILDAYPLRRLGPDPDRPGGSPVGRVVAEKLPFLALSLVFVAVALRAKEGVLIPARVQPGGIASRLAHACYSACFYPLKTIVPVSLTAYYPLPDRIVWYEPRFVLSAVVVVGVSLILVGLRRRLPGLLAAWASYLALLVPNSGLTRIGASLVADRYSYIAMIGLVAVLAAGCAALLWPRRAAVPRGVVAVVGLGLLAGLTVLSVRQCLTWRNTVALWRHAIAHTRRPTPEMYLYLGLAQFASEGPTAAVPTLMRAAELGPADPEIQTSLGSMLSSEGRFDEAADHLALATRLKPESVQAHTQLGRNRFLQGQGEAATAALRRAVELSPDDPTPRKTLGGVLFAQGQYALAADQFRRLVERSPEDSEAHYELGVCLLRQSRLDEADAQLTEALRLKPDYAEAINDLGAVRASEGRLEAAARQFAEALRLKPELADAHYNTALLLALEGQFARAEEHLVRALKSRPKHALAQRALEAVRKAGARAGGP
jgi:Flp pilus assembly protein TadD